MPSLYQSNGNYVSDNSKNLLLRFSSQSMESTDVFINAFGKCMIYDFDLFERSSYDHFRVDHITQDK